MFRVVHRFALFLLLCCGLFDSTASAGCALTNPLKDLKYMFPQMTRYKEEVRDFSTMKNGRALYRALNVRLGSDLDQLYEAFGTQYAIYTIFKGKEVIGIVHGVDVPGEAGLIQVVLSMDPRSAIIRKIYFQRLDSRAARALNRKGFLDQFLGLSLADFYRHDYYEVAEPGSRKDRIARIKNPAAGAKDGRDYDAIVRGVRKNLILLDFFVYGRRSESVHQQTRTRLARIKH